jgi:hypothetical protein
VCTHLHADECDIKCACQSLEAKKAQRCWVAGYPASLERTGPQPVDKLDRQYRHAGTTQHCIKHPHPMFRAGTLDGAVQRGKLKS